MSDSDTSVSAENVESKMGNTEKYTDIGKAEKHFRDKLNVDRSVYLTLGGLYGHLEHHPEKNMNIDPKKYIVNEYREAEQKVIQEFTVLSTQEVRSDSFIQEQIANYVEEKVMTNGRDAFESLRWKIDSGLHHIADQSKDPIADSQAMVDTPVASDGGLELTSEAEEETEQSMDMYNTYYQFIDEGLDLSMNDQRDVLVERVLQHIPESHSHRYKDSFEDLLNKSLVEKKGEIVARAANEVDKRMDNDNDTSKKEKILIAVSGGIITSAIKMSLKHLYKHSKRFGAGIFDELDISVVLDIFVEFGRLICDNADTILHAIGL